MLSWNLHFLQVKKYMDIFIYLFIFIHWYIFIYICTRIFTHTDIFKCVPIFHHLEKPRVKAWSNQSLGRLYSCLIHTSSRFRINFKITIHKKVQSESSTTKIYYSSSLFIAHISSNLIMTMCVLYEYLQVGQFHIQERKGIPVYHISGWNHTIYIILMDPSQKDLRQIPFCGLDDIRRWDWYKVSGPISIVINGGTWGALEMAERNNEVTRVITCYDPTFITGDGAYPCSIHHSLILLITKTPLAGYPTYHRHHDCCFGSNGFSRRNARVDPTKTVMIS